MQNKTVLIIIVLLTVSIVIFLAGIVYLRTDRQVSNPQQQTAQQPESEHVQRILEETGANLNTVGLVVYENNSFEREQLTFEKDPTESILITVINRDPATVEFSIAQQPQGSQLPQYFLLTSNQKEEFEIQASGEYIIQVGDMSRAITLTVL